MMMIMVVVVVVVRVIVSTDTVWCGVLRDLSER